MEREETYCSRCEVPIIMLNPIPPCRENGKCWAFILRIDSDPKDEDGTKCGHPISPFRGKDVGVCSLECMVSHGEKGAKQDIRSCRMNDTRPTCLRGGVVDCPCAQEFYTLGKSSSWLRQAQRHILC
jgi:hypothetical protein